MKKQYTSPELEMIEFDTWDVILTSPIESSIPEIIGGGEGGGGDELIGDLGL